MKTVTLNPGPGLARFLKVHAKEIQSLKSKPYQRKTRDEFSVEGHYAHGWEAVTTEDTRSEARARLREYRENETGTAFRLVKHRVRIEAA